MARWCRTRRPLAWTPLLSSLRRVATSCVPVGGSFHKGCSRATHRSAGEMPRPSCALAGSSSSSSSSSFAKATDGSRRARGEAARTEWPDGGSRAPPRPRPCPPWPRPRPRPCPPPLERWSRSRARSRSRSPSRLRSRSWCRSRRARSRSRPRSSSRRSESGGSVSSHHGQSLPLGFDAPHSHFQWRERRPLLERGRTGMTAGTR